MLLIQEGGDEACIDCVREKTGCATPDVVTFRDHPHHCPGCVHHATSTGPRGTGEKEVNEIALGPKHSAICKCGAASPDHDHGQDLKSLRRICPDLAHWCDRPQTRRHDHERDVICSPKKGVYSPARGALKSPHTNVEVVTKIRDAVGCRQDQIHVRREVLAIEPEAQTSS